MSVCDPHRGPCKTARGLDDCGVRIRANRQPVEDEFEEEDCGRYEQDTDLDFNSQHDLTLGKIFEMSGG